ncbi:15035_t:CDS:2 [Funneliformis caledonium]|uniref:15035_t:CDS:1 n=1 Tax=Funneliformis caledonium TaxID=1117310 RepID=A0A9N9ILD2_9GLOM|nr:15035_t:CDS:2 [Funneliformis caledonium]
MADPRNLKIAINKAKATKARTYYMKESSQAINNNMEQLSLNYANIVNVLAVQNGISKPINTLSRNTNATIRNNNDRKSYDKVKCYLTLAPSINSLEFLDDEHGKKTTSYKAYIKIKNNFIKAIIDIRAIVNIITNKLVKKLGLNIDKSSKLIVTTANESFRTNY